MPYDSQEAYMQALEAGEEVFQMMHDNADHSDVILVDHPDLHAAEPETDHSEQ